MHVRHRYAIFLVEEIIFILKNTYKCKITPKGLDALLKMQTIAKFCRFWKIYANYQYTI